MIMEVEDTRFGENGVMFLADCGVIPEPTVDQLADIAVSTAHLSRQILGVRPRVAMLSYSTKGSATHPTIGRVQAATALAQQKAAQKGLEADFDGELQVDAALVPEMPDARFRRQGGAPTCWCFPISTRQTPASWCNTSPALTLTAQILRPLAWLAADVAPRSSARHPRVRLIVPTMVTRNSTSTQCLPGELRS
jgi:phosphate acetyltransferase